MTIHTTFYRGKRVFVQLRNGTNFVDRWVTGRSRSGQKVYAEFQEHGKIALRNIRSITIYRGGVQEQDGTE